MRVTVVESYRWVAEMELIFYYWERFDRRMVVIEGRHVGLGS